MPDLVVRDLKTREEICRIDCGRPSRHNLEKTMVGMLHNLNERYFVDASEFDYLYVPTSSSSRAPSTDPHPEISEMSRRAIAKGIASVVHRPSLDPPRRTNMQMIDGFPRRNRVDHWTPAEKAIQDAVDVVEAAGAHPLLTDAVILLGQAREKVADFVEAQPQTPENTP